MAKNNQIEIDELNTKPIQQKIKEELVEDEDDEEEDNGDWEDWRDDDEEEEADSNFLCLFCDSKYSSCIELLDHCGFTHKFDLKGIRKELCLDFYGSFKFINYVRSMVAENRCWSCGVTCKSNRYLQCHLHDAVNLKDIKLFWDDDRYLKPFLQDDSLLYSFIGDEESEEDFATQVDKEELMKDLRNIEEIRIEDDQTGQVSAAISDKFEGNGIKEVASVSKGPLNLAVTEIKKVNENYFGAYSSFGIHREMISDKVRMDAYRQAILKNPSLLTGAVVMDVGCGTGILSLFAAQAGASRVIAVEASEKMAAVATQIAKDNGLWHSNTQGEGNSKCTGVMEVVQGMVEELDIQIEPHSVDVLVSEWMGYCLLYESMLSSVLYARDKWLRPGGAILPDTATIYAAGFGKGGTSLPFWEDVYGLNMTCIGKELVQDAAQIPIIDIVNDCDLVTDAAVLQSFDLATMKPEDVDFTASIELKPKLGKTTWCYGVVLWFDTDFTTRFCKETPAVLSTSPFTPKTHWSQTILTFREPIAVAPAKPPADLSAAVGTDACPAARIHLRISIVRAIEHRSIDISMEPITVGPVGQKRNWPVQIFNLS
ncbi:probable protein arginine N-methyltransferase 3 [Ricinus communis]|uniref:probable protein arginine N-methyltransferase 3 n=1 Tax=Ricinus communis TaxID=3988 RepID=UPI00201ABA35|nr:probable protein arginine N-methyltransferase 3 [Ricinus communis]